MFISAKSAPKLSLLRYLRKHVVIPAVEDHQPNKCQSHYSKTSNFQEHLQVNHKIVVKNTPTDELNFRATRQRPHSISTSNQRKTENANDGDCTIIEDELACLKFEPDEEDKIYIFDREKQILPYVDASHNSPQKSVHNEDRTKANNHELNFIDHDEGQDSTTTIQTTVQPQNCQTSKIGTDSSVNNTTEVNSCKEATTCKECKLACTTLENLCIHYETLHKLPAVSLARVTANQVQHMKTHRNLKQLKSSGKRFNCKVCQKTFCWLEGLRRHTQRVHKEIRYKCNICPKQFNHMNNLNRHKSSVHNNVRFKCDVCQKEFKWRQNLHQHRLLIHRNIKFKCDKCPKQFSSSQYLRFHKEGIHEGVRYKCQMCGREFRREGCLKEHKASSHDGIRYKCEICEKQFRWRQNLREHKESSHAGIRYKCDVCEKEFSRRGNLKLHKERSHDGVQYKCDMCEKQFRRKRNLEEHKSSFHDGLRYKCNLCGKEFSRERCLKEHKASSSRRHKARRSSIEVRPMLKRILKHKLSERT